jgi:uncharacterized membrane protein YhiD involved in acid resistance
LNFQDVFTLSLGPGQIAANFTVALLCSLIISFLYRMIYRGTGYSASFVHSIVTLSLITALVIMVIGNNLARAFGLVGSMSIIRFRTAVKDTQDIVFLFLSLGIGMAAGAGYYLIAFTGTLFIGLTLLVLSRVRYGDPNRNEFLVQFSYTASNGDGNSYLPVMAEFAGKYRLVHAKSVGKGETLDLSFLVRLKKTHSAEAFIRQLETSEGVQGVSLFFDEEHA